MLDGIRLSIRVVCLGWHWFAYKYSKTRDDCDHLACKLFPTELDELASRALAVTLPQYQQSLPDVAIINCYGQGAKLGMHQDKSESQTVRNAGSPIIISISLGDTCLFRFGNAENRNGTHQDIELKSGDLFVFGGASRMAFHSVMKVYSGTAPSELGMRTGRLNITIRETGFGLQ